MIYLFFNRAIIAARRFHFPHEAVETHFADTFDAPLPIGTEHEFETFADKTIEFAAFGKRHRRTFGTGRPAMLATARPHCAPRRLFVLPTSRALTFRISPASLATQTAGRDIQMLRTPHYLYFRELKKIRPTK